MLDILLVDDEPLIRLSVGDALRAAGHKVRLASDGAEALNLIAEKVYDVVVTDVRLPRADGFTVFRKAREVSPATDVIIITAFGQVKDAVAALKDGAHDYLTKPFDADELVLRVARIAERRVLEKELAEARDRAANVHPSGIIGRAPGMVRLLERIRDGGGQRRPGAHHRRERHRQGAGRAQPAHALQPQEQGLRGGELRGVPRDPARGGAVRPRARRVHRRGQEARRPLQGRGWRHPPARRDSRRSPSKLRRSCCACCRRGSSLPWAPTPRCRWMRASSRPATATSSSW
ncbi:MAG: response regulator [Myxococcales bacterium]